MVRKVVEVIGVAGGGPVYTLQLQPGETVGILLADVLGVRVAGGTGAVMRASMAPAGDFIEVTDDIKPGGGTYGLPVNATKCWATTPNAQGLLDPPHLASVWEEAWAYNSEILAGIASGAVDEKQDVFTPAPAQTAFVLSFAPAVPAETKAHVNGVKAIYGTSFTVVGTAFTWLDTPFTLDNGDTLEVEYFV